MVVYGWRCGSRRWISQCLAKKTGLELAALEEPQGDLQHSVHLFAGSYSKCMLCQHPRRPYILH